MAKGVYGCIDGVSRKVTKIPLCVDGVSRNTKVGYACVDGVSRKFFGGSTVSDFDVGQSVYMNVKGVSTEFMIVHKGLPSSAYDSSCDGVWLLMKDIYEKREFGTTHDYANSTIHSYLNNTLLTKFDSGIQGIIKQVKIPYRPGKGESTTISTGANGLSTKMFLLSYTEVGCSGDTKAVNEGYKLDYFSNASNATRIAYYQGAATSWWTRSPHTSGQYFVSYILNTGAPMNYACDSSWGVRPAIILPHDIQVDSNFNIIA